METIDRGTAGKRGHPGGGLRLAGVPQLERFGIHGLDCDDDDKVYYVEVDRGIDL